MKTWRINESAPTLGLRRWQDGLADAFVRLDAEQVRNEEFAGRIEQVRLDDSEVSRVSASAHRVVRLAEHAAHSKQDVVFANLQLSGRGRVELPVGVFDPQPLDICIIPTTEPYTITHSTGFDLVSFAIKQEALPAGVEPGILPLSRSAAGRELGNVLGGLVSLAMQMPAASNAVQKQINALLGLAASAVSEVNDDAALRTAICAHIQRMHTRPGLSAAPIAASFNLTERRLHALFAETGQTIGERIEAARLATAAKLLRDTDFTIAMIAHRSGFRDPSYFARVFRRSRDLSPRSWRAAQLS